MKKSLILFFLVSTLLSLKATPQALTYTPLFPTINDNLVITYNADSGVSQLQSDTAVYMHTGVLTDESINHTDWLHKPVHKIDTNASIIKMTHVTQHIYTRTIPIQSYYGIDTSGANAENLREVCFVFRNSNGTHFGKDTGGKDFLIPIYQPGAFAARFIAPLEFPYCPNLNDIIPVKVSCTGNSNIKLYHNATLISDTNGNVLTHNFPAQAGKNWIWFTAANNNDTITDSMYYIVMQSPTIQNPPAGTRDGINYIDNTTVTLQLLAPNKNFTYLIMDSCNWQLDPAYQMKKTTDGQRFWITLTGLTPNKEYPFQYFVENKVKIPDPYADKILDKDADPFINNVTYPDLIDYPFGKTSRLVSVFQTAQAPFTWTDGSFQKPDNRDLVIYELLIRDFYLTHKYKAVKDSLPYLQQLGINAIELMPVMEFEGNDSWGYMPTMHFAPDKYYGAKAELKSLINECHNRGIAVILDIVLNHTSPQNPMAQLYYNEYDRRPGSDNPWFNEFMPHDYGYPCDFDHESTYTRAYVDTVLSYWVREYHADGYRLDLSKGFTNTWTIGGAGNMAQYDASRINSLKRLGNVLWAKHPGTFIILEHFADNQEEKELADFGFLLWSGGYGNQTYRNAGKGWPNDDSNFDWAVSYKNPGRNFAFHNLVGYMESHDEQRLAYDIKTYGCTNNPSYDPLEIDTTLDRAGECAAFFIPVPGPKMMYQFGERGFDYSIYWPAPDSITTERMAQKPPRWDYMNDCERIDLFNTYAALIHLKKNYRISRTNNYEMKVDSKDKRIRLFPYAQSNTGINVVIVGNFNVYPNDVWPEFPHAGTWYDYLNQTSVVVDPSQTQNNNYHLTYAPGEYHIYTDSIIPLPPFRHCDPGAGINEVTGQDPFSASVYPNPFSEEQTINYTLPASGTVVVKVYDLIGSEVITLVNSHQQKGTHYLTWDGTNRMGEKITSGYYYCTIQSGNYSSTNKIVYIKD